MITLITAALLGLTAYCGSGATANKIETSAKDENEIVCVSKEDNLESFAWHNNTQKLDEDSKEFFDKYEVDENEALSSSDVYIQTETMQFDEQLSADYTGTAFSLTGIGSDYSDSYTHNEGYIKFTTTAYGIGFYDGGIVYHVEIKTEQQKSFVVNQNDNIIIQHGDNSVSLINDECKAKGSRYTPCTIYWINNPIPTIADEHQILEPDYSCSDGGVYYTFKANGTDASDQNVSVQYGYTTVTADYYLIATDTTEIQPTYVHNINWFIDSLSLTFGKIGVGINVNTPNNDVMVGHAMTLKGYSDRIESSTLRMEPNNYDFEPRYFFYEKTNAYNVQGWSFDTKRLRCGYIEQEYVNLSPDRQNAGTAYLEFKFQVPVYEFSTNLSFWSPSERYLTGNGDSAYLQYKDPNGDWKNWLDLLNCSLPTDRSKQKFYEFDSIYGTYGIRIVANKNDPDSIRNKGRICIGETKFVTNWVN